ncbi:MAG: tyrosine-type recombinase/integrase [Eggerthellaceae bacterium]|nr:tyrosine-type recombinase/integrase [Eggerthellaceae bacterium]
MRARIVKIADRYASGEMPCTGKPVGGKTVTPKSAEFESLLEGLDGYADDRGLAAKTRSDYRYMASLYLVYLEGNGVTSLREAKASTVAGFISHLSEAGSKSPKSLIVSHLRPLFVMAGRDDLYRASQMVGARQPHEPHTVLDDADAEALAAVCVNGDVPAASAAATLLALTTGLRGCDIACLELSCIDWRRTLITIVQRKTGNPVTVPLLPAVADAIARYILDERPDTGDPHVFLGSRQPHRPFKNASSIRDLIEVAFIAAGIERTPVGTRILRHSAATRMLRSGEVPLATISAVLGHAGPSTTEAYLEADSGHMLECVLPLPKGAMA